MNNDVVINKLSVFTGSVDDKLFKLYSYNNSATSLPDAENQYLSSLTSKTGSTDDLWKALLDQSSYTHREQYWNNFTFAPTVAGFLKDTESSMHLADTGLWQERTPATLADAQDDLVGVWEDVSQTGGVSATPATHNDQTATADANRGTLDISSGVYSVVFNGTNTFYTGPNFITTGLSSVFVTVKTSDDIGAILSPATSGTQFLGSWASASSATSINGEAGTPSIYIDETLFTGTTRGDFHTAIADGGWHLIEFRGADVDAWTNYNLCGFRTSTFEYAGNIGGLIITTESLGTENNTVINKLLKDKVGI